LIDDDAVQGMGRSSAHTSTKVKMLTPFSLRSRHAEVTTSSAVTTEHPLEQFPRRRSGSDRHLPASAVELHAHRRSDGSPRVSLPTVTTQPKTFEQGRHQIDDVTELRARVQLTSSPGVGLSVTADEKSSESDSGTITTKSSEDLNSRLAASLTRWSTRHDDSKISSHTGDVTDSRAPGVITSSPPDARSAPETPSIKTGTYEARQSTVAGDVTDSRAQEVTTSSHRVGQSARDASATVQVSGIRSTPAVQQSILSSTQPHAASMSDMSNFEPRTSGRDTTSRPRSTIYGDIRDRVFGAKQQPTKPASPFSVFEPIRDENAGKKVSTIFTGGEQSKLAAKTVSEEPNTATISGITSETGQLQASGSCASVPAGTVLVDQGMISSTAETKSDLLRVESTASSHVSSTVGHVASTVSSDSRGYSAVDGGNVSVPRHLPGQVPVSSVTQNQQQRPAAVADALATLQQRDQTRSQGKTGVGHSVTTRAEVPPWTQTHPGTTTQWKSEVSTANAETPTGKVGIQQMGSVLPSRSTADNAVLPVPSTSSVRTTVGKIVPSPTSRVDWAKQRFGGTQSSLAGVPASSPKLKHRTFSDPQPDAGIANDTVLSYLDDSISKLAAAAAAKVISSTSVQEQSRASQMIVYSTAGLPASTAAHTPPFKPLTVSPTTTVSPRVAIVHGLQMSPPTTTPAPRAPTEQGASAWSAALTGQQSGAARPQGSSRSVVILAASGSDLRSTTSSSAPPISPSSWQSPSRPVHSGVRPVQPGVSISTSQGPSSVLVSSNVSIGSLIQSHVPPVAVSSPPVAASAGVRSTPSVQVSNLVSTSSQPASFPAHHIQTTATMFSVEKPVISQVLARPALPMVVARVWQPQVPQIQLRAQPLKSVFEVQSPVPESKLVLVAPQTTSAVSPPAPDRKVQTQVGSHTDDSRPLYSTQTRQEPLGSRVQQVETPRTSSSSRDHVAVTQSQVPVSVHGTQAGVTQNQVRTPAPAGQIVAQQGQVWTQVQPSQAGSSLAQTVTKPASPGHPAVLEIQAATSAQPSRVSRIEARGQGIPNQVGFLPQSETNFTGVASSMSSGPTISAVAQKETRPQATTDSRGLQGGTVAVPDRQMTVSSLGVEQKRRGGTAAVADEVDQALRELDSIAAETRSFSASLGRTTATSASSTTTTTPPRAQTSQTSTAVVVGSPRDTDQKPRHQMSPRAENKPLQLAMNLDSGVVKQKRETTKPLQSAKSLDSSGVIKKHLVHLESIFRPGASDQHVKKSVHLRKPRPLRKAQTVDLTAVGIGVDPELMQLLSTRKEKSASDDEDAAAKPRDDVVSATSRYETY